ncbi:MAG: prepilin peptidase [bacterium]
MIIQGNLCFFTYMLQFLLGFIVGKFIFDWVYIYKRETFLLQDESKDFQYQIILQGFCGILTVWLGYVWGLTPLFWMYSILIWVSIAVSLYDLKDMIIPNELTFFLIISGFLFALLIPELKLSSAFVGFLLGGGILLMLALLSGGNGMGGGDIKYLAGIGSYVGGGLFPAFGVIQVLIYSLFMFMFIITPLLIFRKVSAKQHVPFGPFLAIGTFLYCIL